MTTRNLAEIMSLVSIIIPSTVEFIIIYLVKRFPIVISDAFPKRQGVSLLFRGSEPAGIETLITQIATRLSQPIAALAFSASSSSFDHHVIAEVFSPIFLIMTILIY